MLWYLIVVVNIFSLTQTLLSGMGEAHSSDNLSYRVMPSPPLLHPWK